MRSGTSHTITVRDCRWSPFQRGTSLGASSSMSSWEPDCFGRGGPTVSYEITLRGLDLDPLFLRAQTEVGWGLFMAGRVDEGIAELRGVLELEPDHYFARRALGILDV